MALTADEVPIAITGAAPLLRGAANVGKYPNVVEGSMLPYGTTALLPPFGEVMSAIDSSAYALPPSSVPTGKNPAIPF